MTKKTVRFAGNEKEFEAHQRGENSKPRAAPKVTVDEDRREISAIFCGAQEKLILQQPKPKVIVDDFARESHKVAKKFFSKKKSQTSESSVVPQVIDTQEYGIYSLSTQ